MTTQPEALRLADWLEPHGEETGYSKAAAELRRLHQSEREGWRYADELEQERKRLTALNQEWERVCDQHLRHIAKLKKRLAKAEGRA